MKIGMITDTHENYPTIEHCDIVIHAGDFTFLGDQKHVRRFFKWFSELDATYKLFVAGNHDLTFDSTIKAGAPAKKWMADYGIVEGNYQDATPGTYYLENSLLYVEGLEIFGSPWSMPFGRWAFMVPDHIAGEDYELISPSTDIVISHGPAYGVLDKIYNGELVGSHTLLEAVCINEPQLLITGHIHEARGIHQLGPTQCLNPNHWTHLPKKALRPPMYLTL